MPKFKSRIELNKYLKEIILEKNFNNLFFAKIS